LVKLGGLKPSIVSWIYTTVIRPTVTYDSTAWWPRLTYKVSRTELTQRLACLAITAASRMAQTAAMEAQAGAYRLTCIQQWKLKSTNFGHARQSQNMEHEPIL
jgi:hypothetical protein